MPYDLGNVVPLQVNISNEAGVAEDAGAVTFTIKLPDETVITPVVLHPGVGVYRVDYLPPQYGRYSWSAVATGANSAATNDIFDVRPAGSTNLLSLADARATLNLSATADDEELRDYIAATTSMIEARIGPVLPRTVTERVTGRNWLILSAAPIVSVESLTGTLDATPALTPADLSVDTGTGIIGLATGYPVGQWAYDVTYTSGRVGPIEPRITQAARVLLRHLWSTQRGSNSRGRGETDDFAANYSMPNRVLELLATDLKSPGVA